ncbi:MAG: FAD/NAD(P)-binding protein [Actinomycetota bacterium]|nr:FAD/NAD(P)-binding protein [Actinomycetota bacterium]
MDDPWVPMVGVVDHVVPETPDSATFWITLRESERRGRYQFEPGQFNMLYLFGIGEVPISISSDPERPARIGHTIRFAGRVTNAFRALKRGDEIGVRGPYGRPWPLHQAEGRDLVVVAGGLGICPVRPAADVAIRHRNRFRRVIFLLGARVPEQLPYRSELERWLGWVEERGIEVLITVDQASEDWPYSVGVVTRLFDRARIDAGLSTAFVCGPETMMRASARALVQLGIPSTDIFVSLERNMQCAVRMCGHCQFGPSFLCADGPVFGYDRVADMLEIAQL